MSAQPETAPTAERDAASTAERDAASTAERDAAPTAGPDTLAPPDAVPALPEDRFGNRELSSLEFNARVLALAEDESQPLMERVNFLAIQANNVDEFYMVRVAGLKRRQSMGLSVRSMDQLTVREQLARISERAQELAERQARCFLEQVAPALAEHGIRFAHWDDLGEAERGRLHDYFREQIFPVLTPLAVDPAHPFPYISGLSLNLAVTVRDPDGHVERFARIKVPNNVPRFVAVTESGQVTTAARSGAAVSFLPLEDLIAAHLPTLFPGMRVVEHDVFRVIRNADFEVDEDRDEDLLQALERELARRRFGPAVRLEVAESMSPRVRELLVRELDVGAADVFSTPGLLDLSALWQLSDVGRPELERPAFVPATHPRLTEGESPRSVFAVLRDGDVLVHHPYDSFATSVQRFIEQAAADPHVLAIKLTLYRTSGDSPIVDALIDAAEAGKQVVVIVEIKARFDEQANITWARALERAGCHVVYGLIGLKTHCKIALVVRQEAGALRRYCHIGTGNYNPKTARIYEDLGLLTADPAIGEDLTALFNVLTGYARQPSYRRLLVAPQGVRSGIVERIEHQAEIARSGGAARIRIKVNHLVDEVTIDALYRASLAGVPIDLLTRTNCALRPGVPGLSQNIRVRSIVGRFLEHSRVYIFGVGDDAEFLLGSADLMHRNLDRRVEVLVRVSEPTAAEHLEEVVELAMADDTAGWDLGPDGEWRHVAGPGRRDYQEELVRRLASRAE
ncbi:MAG: RNA degradosome polyphosphate kinase [Pseudonocardiales bacterium]|nr:MAG: RNA degradosome polyphosphate kinase [Pseudonocardiales bacterium]